MGLQNKKNTGKPMFFYLGAEDEARTRYLHLGKVALYQMSYSRTAKTIIACFFQLSIVF